MARDAEDRFVLIGDAWVWLSDVISIVPVEHAAVRGIKDIENCEGKLSVVATEGLSICLLDERSPEQLVKDLCEVR